MSGIVNLAIKNYDYLISVAGKLLIYYTGVCVNVQVCMLIQKCTDLDGGTN